MGYMKIPNLYNDTRIFNFEECYAMEKIHGTSAHIRWDGKEVIFFSGGEKHENFVKLFNVEDLKVTFTELCGENSLTVYGEAYGGKQQGMSDTYGKELKFIAFDVRMGDGTWLTVPEAEAFVTLALDLEFVDYVKVATKLHLLDAERDMPSVQAHKNGISEDKVREGIVIRPIQEEVDHKGNRIITKHKCAAFSEVEHVKMVDLEALEEKNRKAVLADAWVTEMRLHHVLDKVKADRIEAAHQMGDDTIDTPFDMKDTSIIIGAMVKDVMAESEGQLVWDKAMGSAVASATARLFKLYLHKKLEEAVGK